MIDGVKIKELKVIPDDRGELMEMMRCDEEFYNGFGQVYMSTTYPGVVKGWHYHKLQEDNMVCMKGDLMVGLFDNRENSPTKGQTTKIIVGHENAGGVLDLLGSGQEFGVKLTYKVQDEPRGIANALAAAEDFIENEKFIVLLGDNIFEENLKEAIEEFKNSESQAKVFFLKKMNNIKK